MNKEERPAQIGKYTELVLIGEGGCAKVFEAFDPELERRVALKLLSPRLSADEKMREQFFREIKVQANLNIPGIVKVFDCGSSPHGLYYSMELVNGLSLEKYCWNNHLTLQKKLSLLGEVAAIVDKLHSKGMLHRDIKPGNVMIDEYEQVKLLDLGLVAMIEDEIKLIDDFQISGSPAYMPPEALRDKNVNSVTAAADIYSLAVMAYEIVCARLPYDVDFLSLQELFEVVNNEAPQPIYTPFNEKIPRKAEKIIMQGLSVNPADRPSAAEFAKAMKESSEVNGGILKPAAIILASAISAGLIYHLFALPDNEINVPQNAPVKKTFRLPPRKPHPQLLPKYGKFRNAKLFTGIRRPKISQRNGGR
ncbi:MAG: serine/threonine-protein kinase [Victivallaceae bacterium]